MEGLIMRQLILDVSEHILAGGVIGEEDALKLADVAGQDLFLLLSEAGRIREKFVGCSVTLCSIINAKSGRCPENCAFCAQSAHNATSVANYELVDEEEMVSCAKKAQENGASCYGIITSGTGISKGPELDRICATLARIRSEADIIPSCSLGIMDC